MGYATESKSTSEPSRSLSASAFQAMTGASDGMMADFAVYHEALRRWQGKINLVGASTMRDPWRRHFLDCAQLYPLIPPGAATLVDIGSGAGFPGLVLAIIAKGRRADGPAPSVHVIESDQRKCIFLNEIIRLTGIGATVHNLRAEVYDGPKGDIVTARGCAPLDRLLAWAAAILDERGHGLFLKGENVGDELTLAAKDWRMTTIEHASRSDSRGVILQVKNLARCPDA